MKDETITMIFLAGFASLAAVFVIVIGVSIFAKTEAKTITLDSGKQCVVTVKLNDVTNLDCEG